MTDKQARKEYLKKREEVSNLIAVALALQVLSHHLAENRDKKLVVRESGKIVGVYLEMKDEEDAETGGS